MKKCAQRAETKRLIQTHQWIRRNAERARIESQQRKKSGQSASDAERRRQVRIGAVRQQAVIAYDQVARACWSLAVVAQLLQPHGCDLRRRIEDHESRRPPRPLARPLLRADAVFPYVAMECLPYAAQLIRMASLSLAHAPASVAHSSINIQPER